MRRHFRCTAPRIGLLGAQHRDLVSGAQQWSASRRWDELVPLCVRPEIWRRIRPPRRRSRAGRRSTDSSSWGSWDGAPWARSTQRMILSSIARLRSSCCVRAATIATRAMRGARPIREAQAIAKVSHPNVVVVYDVGTFEGRVFIAMEFIAGHTLGYWLQSQPRTVAGDPRRLPGAGRGLAAAHARGWSIATSSPKTSWSAVDGQARVMDFGLVRLAIDRDKPDGIGRARRRGCWPAKIASAVGQVL